jgi:hypothetical protein
MTTVAPISDSIAAVAKPVCVACKCRTFQVLHNDVEHLRTKTSSKAAVKQL